MESPAYFLCDAHLGIEPPGCVPDREAKLVRQLESWVGKASHVVIVGDLFEFWYEYRYYVASGHMELYRVLGELVRSGTQVHLLRAYTAAADSEAFPREHCRGVAAVQAQVQQNAPASAWGLGATIIPFWPALPVDETWTYTLSARIFCDGTLVKRVEFTEESRVQAFWYGMMRSDLLNEASSEMHKKLVQRLSFELRNRQADLNSASDY